MEETTGEAKEVWQMDSMPETKNIIWSKFDLS
jgi:hypothetical protein